MSESIQELENQIQELRAELTKSRNRAAPEPVGEYEFAVAGGSASLTSLFGDKPDLLVVHNMGASCPYCTLWADGLNGYLRFIEQRCAIVLCTPDSPDSAAALARSRGWNWHIVSDVEGKFSQAMGFHTDAGWAPGISGFHKQGEAVSRTGHTSFGPGDEFCPVWPAFELLKGGDAGWEPRG